MIFTHPEHGEDFAEIFREAVAALPNEPAPEALYIERPAPRGKPGGRRGQTISLEDLT